jgi:hypothetical protein
MTSLSVAQRVLLGSQVPRIYHVPEMTSTTGPEVIEVCNEVGLVLDSWQQLVLNRGLGEKPDGTWAALTAAVVCPRQNGKNAIEEALELGGLFVLHEQGILHTAHEQATASEQFRRLLGLIDGSRYLRRRIQRVVRGKGSEAIEFQSGQRIFFKTRTGSGARGFTINRIICDEAYELSEAALAAVSPTTLTDPNAQTWFFSSAVDQQTNQNGIVLARQRVAALAGAPGLAYFEWSVPGGDPSRVPESIATDPIMWAQANPGLGIRLAPEALERERVKLGPRKFAVECLGIGDWPDTSDGAANVIDLGRWDALADDGSELAGPVFLAFDVAPDRSSAAIGAAALRADGKTHVELVEHAKGTGWVAQSLAERVEALTAVPGAIVCDATGPAGSLVTAVEEALGREITIVSAKEHAQAFGLFVDAVEQGTLRHLGDAELRAALDGATKRPLGEAFAWSRIKSDVDISPLVACTLALWACGQGTGPPEVWSLDEMVARLQAEQEGRTLEPAAGPAPEPPVANGGQRFIALDQMPARY